VPSSDIIVWVSIDTMQFGDIKKIYYTEDNAVTNMGRQYTGGEHQSQIINNTNTQEYAHQDCGDDGQGLQVREGDRRRGRGGRDDGQADDQYGDSAQMNGGGGCEVHAGGHGYLREQTPQDGPVQGNEERGDQAEVGSHQADGGDGGVRAEREDGQADGRDEGTQLSL
jgi:hypothetical protein